MLIEYVNKTPSTNPSGIRRKSYMTCQRYMKLFPKGKTMSTSTSFVKWISGNRYVLITHVRSTIAPALLFSWSKLLEESTLTEVYTH